MMFLWTLIQSVFAHLVGQEISSRLPKFIDAIVRGAVSHLPKAHREEMGEEWRSVLADFQDQPLTRLVHALGFICAAYGMSFEEYRIRNRRDWLIFEGTIQVLTGVGGVWALERAESLPGVKQSRLFGRLHVGVLTFMVDGFGKHADAHLIAADRFAELGNTDMEKASRIEGEKLAEQVLDRIVDVSIISAFQEMSDDDK